ncbi:non-ribosomal peptide synthetase [Streptomyces sp. NBC_01497]|uniref:non-ribosomal peptide synthetase n=1 Tax=Streptomyces sp. NBC_01497 TaxID=2903885 RepID=UPI002E32A668|nr:non-ribosomal peptide synthetase [Streptomyces sp. NBC_01497]
MGLLAGAVHAQSLRTPHADAVIDGEHRLDHAALDAAAATVAAALRARGVRRGQAVALALPRSWRLVCAMLGVLRAGACVVPLDRLSPPHRRGHILADSGAVAVVHDGTPPPDLPGEVLPLAVDDLLASTGVRLAEAVGGEGEGTDHEQVAGEGREGMSAVAEPVSFLFYTSGTTGLPKGVEVRDAGVLRLAAPGYLDLRPGTRFACMSNPAFDALSFEVWTPLLTGGSCVVLRDDEVQDPHRLDAALLREGVDIAFVTSALFHAVADTVPGCFAGARDVLVGGEALNSPAIQRWYKHNASSATRLHNVYGPTESTTFALSHTIPRGFPGDSVPIGRPLPGTGVAFAVPGGTRAAPPGEVAELLLSGAGLAAGYRNLPEETRSRFVTLPGSDGAPVRHYRTGDLVRADSAGLVTYVGRADRQVKVRGFRIEPGEVERQIRAHPWVRQAHVCTRVPGRGGPRELLAYVVADDGLSFEDFDRHLAARLPGYMRPHHIHRVGDLPRTANGKVDEKALLSLGGAPWRAPVDEGVPVTERCREVLELAGGLLGPRDLRPGDRWTAVGGDSLGALRLRFEARRRWNRDLSASFVLRSDFAGIAAALDAAGAEGDGTDHSPYPVPAGPAGADSAPATSEQQRLWLLHRRDPGSPAYHAGQAFRIDGRLDPDALRRALTRLVERHVALRTGFEAGQEGLRQVVGAPYDPWYDPGSRPPRAEADALAFADRFFAEPFDLAVPRMLRACWLPSHGSGGSDDSAIPDGSDGSDGSASPGDGGVLLLHLHHIAVDGWSLGVLFEHLSADYAAELDGPCGRDRPSAAGPRYTPLDHADWQTRWRGGPAYREQLEGLLRYYEADAADDAVGDRAGVAEPLRSARSSTGGGRLLRSGLDVARRATVDRLCAELNLTRFELLLGVFAWSAYGVTGRTRLRVASPTAGRPISACEHSVGMFANTVLLPLAVAPREGLRAQVARLAEGARAVLERQDVVLADVLAADGFAGTAAGTAPFDFLFVLENTDFGALDLRECSARPVWRPPAGVKCPLTLSLVEHGDGFDCLWEYAEDHFTPAEAQALATLFVSGIDLLAQDGTTTPARLVGPYRRSLPDHGTGAPVRPGPYRTVAEGFARQVALRPDAPALASGDRVLSYGELDRHARALAGELLGAFPLPGPDDPGACRVALYFEPSVEHVVALLALARLGITAVPLDPAYPTALLRQVLEQAEPLCVLLAADGGAAFDAVAPPGGPPRHPVVRPAGNTPHPDSVRLPAPGDGGARPLYTLFTSGSTGAPKGVQVADRTLCDLLHWQEGPGALPGPAVTQQFSMLSFDVSFQEIFGTLCGGGLLHLVDQDLRHDPPALLRRLESTGAQRLHLPYVALQLLAEHAVHLGLYPSRLRDVVTAGEQLVCTDAIRRWFAGMPGAHLHNHYGPTETHVVSALRLDGDPAHWPERPAVGSAVSGALLRVVDEGDEPVPAGCTGDLLIGGSMVSRCYLGDQGLNERRFVELPGLGLFYRSGDRARFDTAGLLHFAGRDDQQIKFSGHRLELGQVEAALLRHPDVVSAVVVRDGGALVGCVQCHAGRGDVTHEGLSAHLASLLPPFVRLDRFRLLTVLPRTPSGKLDRKAALTAPGEDLPHDPGAGPGGRTGPPVRSGGTGRPLDAEPVGPRSARPRASGPVGSAPLEARLAEAFREVTGRTVESGSTFFAAGASSLDLMRFHLHCTTRLGFGFSVTDLFEHVTVAALARFLDAGAAAGGSPGEGNTGTAGAGDEAPGGAAGQPVAAADTAPLPGRGHVTGSRTPSGEPVAVVGMAVRLPGAPDLASFWRMTAGGGRGITHFEAAAGLVGARSQLDGPLAFDPGHFGISPQEARLMDPQQRQLLMSCVEALAHAGIGDTSRVRVGLVAGAGENTYFQAMLRDGDPSQLPDGFQMALHHEKDFLATKAAFHLGLTGPALTTQSACSSSLVAVHVAAGMLRQGDAEVMLAGGVLVDTELTDGYRYRPQHIFSPDGHCRPFSDDAAGTVGGSGAGVVVLKPLSTARRDGDTVYAVLTGSAVNNDGSDKMSYSAPSLTGQRTVIRDALRRSGRTGADIGYVEAHGTGTRLGDPIEVAALRQALGATEPGTCALSSVKSQIGHLGAAAGVVGLVRASLALHHGEIPPTVDFHAPNPAFGDDLAPFHIPTRAEPWPAGRDRVASVSSFGIGGTNAHVVLEDGSATTREAESAARTPNAAASPERCLVLSSSSEAALRRDARRIADHLAARPDTFAQTVRHLREGRPALRWRAAAPCADAAAAVAWLRAVGEDGGTGAVRTTPGPDLPPLAPAGLDARDLADAWTAGRPIAGTGEPAPAPWDFPPPAFDPRDHVFARLPASGARTGPALGPAAARTGSSEPPTHPRTSLAAGPALPAPAGTPLAPPAGATDGPPRLAEADWLHQPQWVRSHRAATGARPRPGPGEAARSPRALVVVTDGEVPPGALRPFADRHAHVVHATAGPGFERRGDGAYQVDPVDPASLRLLIDAVADSGHAGIDWLHALPLAVSGVPGPGTLEHARRACLDAPAALLQAVTGRPGTPPVRPWWLSYGARPVDGTVTRPELGLLAGAATVAEQEGFPRGHWVDLPTDDLGACAGGLAELVAHAGRVPGAHGTARNTGIPAQLALRQGFWWRPATVPVDAGPAGTPALPAGGDHLILGGTGGIGTAVAQWLLERGTGRVLLLARRPHLPDALRRWADRVVLVEADLRAAEPGGSGGAGAISGSGAPGGADDSGGIESVLAAIARRTQSLAGVVHAAGVPDGALLARRDADAARAGTAARLAGALLVERIIARFAPATALYCSSMSALLGGVGQFDYAASAGLLDAFAHHRGGADDTTARFTVDWDVWRETGMALRVPGADARHRAHLARGLDVAEGLRVLDRTYALQLPHLLVSTTGLEASRVFYEGAAPQEGRVRPADGDGSPLPAPMVAAPPPDGPPDAAQGPSGDSAPALLDAWLRDLLGLDAIDPDAALYDLGADSLTMLDLISEVKRHFDIELELSWLSHQVSLAEILAKLRERAPAGGGPDGGTAHAATLAAAPESGTRSASVTAAHAAPGTGTGTAPGSAPETGTGPAPVEAPGTPTTSGTPPLAATGSGPAVGTAPAVVAPAGAGRTPNPRAAAAPAGRARTAHVAIETWQRGTGPDVLCLVHPVGGDIQAYRSLVSALGPHATVCLIADPALGDPAAPEWTLADRASHYRAALRARFPGDAAHLRLAGWSFGAWVALEMACRAEAEDDSFAGLDLLDPPPPESGPLHLHYDDGELETVFAAELSQGGGNGAEGPSRGGEGARAYAERLAHCCRANLRSMAQHRVRPLAATPTRLWLAGRPVEGLPSPPPASGQEALWHPYLPESATCTVLDTTHYGIVRGEHARTVAAALDASLSRTGGDAT